MSTVSPTQGPSTTFTAWQQTVEGKIGDRLTALSSLSQSLQSNTSLSSTERQQLQTEVSNDATGLQALQTKVAGDKTASALHSDESSMVVDYRVFAVEVPKVQLAERMATQEQNIAALQTTLNTQLQASGTNPSATLTDAETELNAAQAAVQGKSDALLAETPQDYTAGLFNQYNGAVNSAAAYLNATRTDLALSR